HGLHGRLLALGELAVAQIVIGERRPFCAGRALHTAALDRFFERAASVESRARTATVPAFAGPVVLFGATGFCFQVGKLHLFPQPVNDIFDSKLQRILDSALLVAALTALRIALLLWPADAIARLRLSLPDALLLVRVAQTEPIVLQHAHRHPYGARPAAEHVGARHDLRQVAPHCIAHLLVVSQPVPGATREEVVPARFAGTALCRFAHVAIATS